MAWIDKRLPVFTFINHNLRDYPTPKNLNYFGISDHSAGITLVIMIVTGILLAMQYTANTDLAFDSVERIMRDVNNGWLLRYIHMNGASMFFIIVYIHIFRGLYYGSYKYPREILVDARSCNFATHDGNSFYGLCFAMGTNEFLGRDSNNKPFFLLSQ